jgi:hypothetical protein
MEKGNKLNFNEILFWLKKKDLAIFHFPKKSLYFFT